MSQVAYREAPAPASDREDPASDVLGTEPEWPRQVEELARRLRERGLDSDCGPGLSGGC